MHPGRAAEPVSPPFLLTVQSQAHLLHATAVISESDGIWLRQKRELVLGVVSQDLAPFEFFYRDGSYKGVTADISSLVAQLLGLRIRLVAFPDRTAAFKALSDKKIDMIGGERSFAVSAGALASTPYVVDKVAIFRRAGETRIIPADLRGLTVSMAADASAVALTAQRYPQARIVNYDTPDQAIAALSFGRSDLYIGGVLPAYYSINRAFFGYVSFERFDDVSVAYSYALRSDNQRLEKLVNDALLALADSLPEIARSWSGSGFVPGGKSIAFTPDELRWIAAHPRLRLVINDDLAPIAFFNSQRRFAGLAADLLGMVSFQTGLKFDVISRRGSFSDQIKAIDQGEADIGIMTATQARETALRFTTPIATDPIVLVTQKGPRQESHSPEPGRIAMAEGHVAGQALGARYPQASIVSVGSTLDGLDMVRAGKVDAAVMALPSADYYNGRLFGDSLQVRDMVDVNPVDISFAVRRNEPELQAILDKTLAALTPDQLSAFTNRWKAVPGMSGETWRDYERIIAEVIAAAALLLLIVLAWAVSLRRQVKAKAKAKRLLKDQLHFVRTLIDSMPPPIYVRDTAGRMLACSHSYLHSLGLESAQVLGKTAAELPGEWFEAAASFHDSYLRAMQSGETVTETHAVRIGGEEVWIDHWIQPFQDSAGQTRGVICGWIDITAHRQLVQELGAAKDQADAASRAKTTFLATMSHEIRTPMNAIIGILELALKRADTQPIDRKSIEIAYSSAHSLLGLIGDILDIVRIESGRLSLTPGRADLREQVESVARVFEGLARQKGLTLQLEIDAGVQAGVLVDALRFKQILSNLVGNAINYTETGFVRIRVQGVVVDPSVLQVNMAVEDSGIGISVENQQRLFRPFFQVRDGARNVGGTGLGLAISRSLCEMMGGRLALTSVPGQGTTVMVELRLQILDPVPMQAPPVGALQEGHRVLQILVVDDHAVSRRILMQQLAFLGHDVQEAPDGESALALFEKHLFDVVFTDSRMPGMSGADLTRAIRLVEQARGAEPTVIIGVTADALPDEIERGVQAGMDECLIKPVGLDALAARLARGMPKCQATSDALSGNAALFDITPLLTVSGGNIDQQWQLLEALMQTNREDAEQLAGCVSAGRVAQAEAIAHRLKGAAKMIRAEGVVRACVALEQACGAGQGDSAALLAAAGRLQAAVHQLESALIRLRDHG